MMREWGAPLLAAILAHGALGMVSWDASQTDVVTPEIRMQLVASLFETPTEQPAVKPKPRPKRRTPKPQPTEQIDTPAPSVEEALTEPAPTEQTDDAREITESEPTPPHDPPPEKVLPEFDLQAYGRGVHASVVRHRSYPRLARQFGFEGRVLVKIRVDRSGGLAQDPIVHRSSGHDILDREALRMVRAAAPFPALPLGYQKPEVGIMIPVSFRLEGV